MCPVERAGDPGMLARVSLLPWTPFPTSREPLTAPSLVCAMHSLPAGSYCFPARSHPAPGFDVILNRLLSGSEDCLTSRLHHPRSRPYRRARLALPRSALSDTCSFSASQPSPPSPPPRPGLRRLLIPWSPPVFKPFRPFVPG